MCTICGSSNCNNSRSREKLVRVYGSYKNYSMERKYLGSVTVNDFDDKQTIQRKVQLKHPDWKEIE